MAILLYDHIELQERPSRHLKTWKGCHLVMYTLAAVFGIVNFVVIQNTMYLVDDNCVLFPRQLEFHIVELPISLDGLDNLQDNSDDSGTAQISDIGPAQKTNLTEPAQDKDAAQGNISSDGHKVKRETADFTADVDNTSDDNVTFIGNTTHRRMLDTSRTLFENDSKCQFAEFMPILSTIFAAVWLTMFTMCPGGGYARSGLQQPWRILMPALLFSLVMVGLTGHSFTTTNKGLHAFCEDFFDVTNSTTCSAVDPYLERGWNASWKFGSRVSAMCRRT